MAINPETQYPGKIEPASAAFPYGKARNITVPGDGTGTPWEAAIVNDALGFQQALLSDAGVVPSGTPDEVGASQYLQALAKSSGLVRNDYTLLRLVESNQLSDRTGCFITADGIGGSFILDKSDVVTTDNDGTVIVDADGGRWKRLYSGAINIGWFGATGGVDDSASIQNTLDYAGSLTPVGKVAINDKIYNAENLSVPDGVDIAGTGGIKHKAASVSPLLSAVGDVSFSDLTIDGDRTNQTGNVDGIVLATGKCIFRDVDFVDMSNRGIGGTCTNFNLMGGSFTGCDNYPIQVAGADVFKVLNADIVYESIDTPVDANVRAIQPTNCTTVIISNCNIDTGRKYRDGIWASGCADVSIVGNDIKETEDDQISVIGTTSRLTITGNTLQGSNSTSGVLLIAVTPDREDITITGNTFNDHVACIDVRDTIGLIIASNTMNNSDEGVRLSVGAPSTDITINSNIMNNIVNFGIDCGDSTNITAVDNKIKGTGVASSIGIHGRNATDLSTSINTIDNFETLIQTANGDNILNGDRLKNAISRAISIQSGDSTTITGAKIKDAPNPIVVVSGQGIVEVIIQGTNIKHSVLQAGVNAIEGGDVVDITILGNIIGNYNRPFASAAGSDQGLYVGNNDRGCTLPPSFTSMTTSVNANNL